MIQLRKITKKYNNITILESISLDFICNHLYVIKGVSGCGKTTLLNIIGCIDNEYSGHYFYDGKDLSNLKKNKIELIRNEMGYVYQDSLLFQHLTVFENLSFFSNDEEQIVRYANQFDVVDLLSKLPSELSNGERQRIAIIRALLGNKKIMLADEPTASLDRSRAIEIVKLFTMLKEQGYLIIVVTHDDVFDSIADEIIKIDYGKIRSNHSEKNINVDTTMLERKPLKGSLFKDLNYSKKRFKKVGIGTFLSLTLIFTVILLSISIRLKFKEEYSSYVKEMYPSHVFPMYTAKPYELGEPNQYTIYKNLGLYTEHSILYSLLPEKDSSLSIPKAIMLGEFPKNENEVVINESYWKHNLSAKKKDDIIGSEVYIDEIEKKFIVSGMLNNDSSMAELVYNGCPFYDVNQVEKPSVFINYKIMESLEMPILNDSIEMVSYPTLEENETLYAFLQNLGGLFWEEMISSQLYGMNMILDIVFICLAIVMVIAYLFIFNIIKFELFNRKREIGFLKLFGINGKRIFRIILLEHIYKVLLPYVIAVVLYSFIAFIIYIYFHVTIYLSLIEWGVVTMLLFTYIYLIIKLPFYKANTSNILQLIRKQ